MQIETLVQHWMGYFVVTMRRSLWLTVIFGCLSLFSEAQVADGQPKGKVVGRVLDKNKEAQIGVTVRLILTSDTNNIKGLVTEVDGRFTFEGVPYANYILKLTYVGLKDLTRKVAVSSALTQMGDFQMEDDINITGQVVIAETVTRGTQIGDTTQFNAGAFKTNQNATSEDLVLKMPGVTSEGGQLKVNGEDVKQVFVDGKPFFGDDPNLSLKNLPAEMVDKVQVYDRKSDQSAFSGFDDGNRLKTINIITKASARKAIFGKAYAGIGPEDAAGDIRYTAGFTLNAFQGARRLTVLGISNNINQQNFSFQDLFGSGASNANRFGGGFRSGGNPGGGGMNMMRMMGGGGGVSGGENFFVGQQSGVNTTNSIGVSLSDALGRKKQGTLTASYFFNTLENNLDQSLNREFFQGGDSAPNYVESTLRASTNRNHRLNLKAELPIDSFQRLTLTTNSRLQNTDGNNQVNAVNQIVGLSPLSSTRTNTRTDGNGYNTDNNILYMLRFRKPARTLSLNFSGTFDGRDTRTDLDGLNEQATPIGMRVDTLEQTSDNAQRTQTLSGRAVYTEPLDSSSALQFSYQLSEQQGTSDVETFSREAAGFSDGFALDSALSSRFENKYMTQRVGLAYRRKVNKTTTLILGVDGQKADLTGEQLFPAPTSIARTFYGVLPELNITGSPKPGSNFTLQYRTSTTPPSVSQLQQIPDNSNPLSLSVGNSALDQDFSHDLTMRYFGFNPLNATGFFWVLRGSYTSNYIGNSTTFVGRDTVLSGGYRAQRGAIITMPVNLDRNFSLRTFFGRSLPVTKIKSNVNLNGGISYSNTPSLLNGETNRSTTTMLIGGAGLSSNVSEKIDFNVNYRANYRFVRNTLQAQQNQDYYTGVITLTGNFVFWKGIVATPSFDGTHYAGLSEGFNQNVFLLNFGLGKRILKEKGEIKMNIYDVLNQNRGIQRTVSDAYVQDTRSNVLTRFVYLQFTYTLRPSKSQKTGASPMPGMPSGQTPNNQGGTPGTPPSGGFPVPR